MSKIEAYKYSFIRRPLLSHALSADPEDNSKILRQKIDYTNRVVPSTLLKLSEKTPAEDEKGVTERRYELLMSEVRQEALREKRALEARSQKYLAELVDLLGVLAHHGAALEEYLRMERTGSENCDRNLELEYRSAKDRLEQQRTKRTFALLKRSVINPERDRPRALAIKRAFDIKLPPRELLHFSHSCQHADGRSSVEKQRKGSLALPKAEVGSIPLQLINEKYRRCQEKVHKLEEALGHEVAMRAEGETLIHELNELVVEGQAELLNARLRAKANALYC